MNASAHRNFITSDSASAPRAKGRLRTGRRVVRMRLHVSLVLLDTLAIVLAFLISHSIFHGGPARYLMIVTTMVPAYLLVAFRADAFSIKTMLRSDFGSVVATQSLTVAAGLVLLIGFCTKQTDDFSRIFVSAGVLGSIALLALSRVVFAHWSRPLLGLNPYEVVLITEDIDMITVHDFTKILPASDFDPKGDCPFMYDRLAVALKDADRVIVACAPDRRVTWVNALTGTNVQAEIFVPELAQTKPMGIAEHNGVPTIVVTMGPLKFHDRFMKRAIDAIVALSALILLIPVFAFVALAIKLDTRGPVFFIQTRIGRNNQMFRMFKFRSMTDGQADGKGDRSTGRIDERVTVVGRYIRSASIDELPQLLNVLWGNMSIVGPRPHALGSRAENLLFWEIDARYWHRHSAKPGLTGLAQVRGYRGATCLRDDLTNRLNADLEYVNNWSLWNDLKIVVRTIGVVIHKNAY
jgi:lipopolysaccharide/colanic/teichoic acid biosynthesis glycosyltransferase